LPYWIGNVRFSRKKVVETEAVPVAAVEVPLAEAFEPTEEEDAPPVLEKPACPKCGWHNVRPSLKRGALDIVLATMSFHAFRCRSCGQRFHSFRRVGGN